MIALRPLFSRQTASTAYKLSSSLPKRPSVVIHARDVHIEKRIEELKIELPTAPLPKANYNIVCMSGDTLYVSGHLPITADGTLLTGTLGPDNGGMTVEEGYAAARHCGLNIISTLKKQLGDLDRVEQVVKVRVLSHCDIVVICIGIAQQQQRRIGCCFVGWHTVFGIVSSHTDFKHQHLVMDGCSDVIMEVFDKPIGYHARSAIGVNTLPLNAPVEVEAIIKIKPE
eukprot:scaffold1339_cov207-Alexandrium_tamarense.AAC.19